MFKTLILKEIKESVLNFRFWLVSVLCLLITPFGLFIASKDYQSRVKEYNNEQNQYMERNQGNVNDQIRAEGYFWPSPLCILSTGLRDYLPYKVTTSKDGLVEIDKKQQESNLQSVLFGKIDFVFIVNNFLSLLSLIFTFGAISSEKESGTLKLVLSNQVPRWKLILAKIFGNYLVFLAPFILSIIIGLIIVLVVTGLNFLSGQHSGPLLIIVLFTMVFLLMFFCLGIWTSIVSQNTISSVVILLFIWAIISFGIPRVSPMLGQIIYPVKTEDIFQKEIRALNLQIQNEWNKKRRELFEKLIVESNINVNYAKGFPNLEEIAEQTNYSEQVEFLNKEFTQRLARELGNSEADFRHKRDRQMDIASNLSRLSPVSSYTFFITELCNTGLLELSNRDETALKFQYQVSSQIYQNYVDNIYIFNGSSIFSSEPRKGFDTENLPVPEMKQYKPVTISSIFQKTWPDILLLLWYTIFFFTGAFVSFLRFDVR